MCLQINPDDKWLLFEQSDTITAYKVVVKANGRLGSVYQNYLWTSGDNVSDREHKEYTEYEGLTRQIFHGIHVFLHQYQAKDMLERHKKYYQNATHVILPVQCHKDDFVAKGIWDDFPDLYASAVFTKVTVKQEDYDKALEGNEVKLCV